MLTKPDTQQLAALANVVQHSRWGKVDELISAEIAQAVEMMVVQTDPVYLHELRGRIKALREFQSTAREASKTLEKLGANNPL